MFSAELIHVLGHASATNWLWRCCSRAGAGAFVAVVYSHPCHLGFCCASLIVPRAWPLLLLYGMMRVFDFAFCSLRRTPVSFFFRGLASFTLCAWLFVRSSCLFVALSWCAVYKNCCVLLLAHLYYRSRSSRLFCLRLAPVELCSHHWLVWRRPFYDK